MENHPGLGADFPGPGPGEPETEKKTAEFPVAGKLRSLFFGQILLRAYSSTLPVSTSLTT